MKEVVLKKGEEKRILRGEPWVYANEAAQIRGEGKQGEVARVIAADGRFVAVGHINQVSKILVRILSYKDEPIDENFYRKKITEAKAYREALGFGDNYRAVFGEADDLPALIVDKYGDYLSCQFLSLGMEKQKQTIVRLLVEIFKPLGIYERSDVAVRKKEGLEETKGVLYGDVPEFVEICENGLKMFVDVINGQKTGYFLDQKENRAALGRYAKGRTVLDCFCNAGGFSLCAAKGGAKSVTAVDVSERALFSVKKNAEANGFEKVIKTEKADVFEFLREARKKGEFYDLIVLDPPAFTKTADTVKDAIRGYKDINVQALKLLKNGGILFTCSCSQHLTVNLFTKMLADAAIESGVKAKFMELRTQCKDHAPLVGSEESLYLKAAALYVIK